MGGYGALRVGLGYPEHYVSINSHSGALGWGRGGERIGIQEVAERRGWTAAFTEEMARIFGDCPVGTEHDVLELARRAHTRGVLPQLLLDCGKDDYLIEDSRNFHAALLADRIPHDYREFAGAHTWDYWDEHVREALAFHARLLAADPRPAGR